MKRIYLALVLSLCLFGLSACANSPTTKVANDAKPAAASTKHDFAKRLITEIRKAGNLMPLAPYLRSKSSFIQERKREFEEMLAMYKEASPEMQADMRRRTKDATGIANFHDANWQTMVCAVLQYKWSQEYADFPGVLRNLGTLQNGGEDETNGHILTVGTREKGLFLISVFKDKQSGIFYIGNINAHGWPEAARQRE